MKEMELTKTFYFDAAHRLSTVNQDHKCSRIHGHTFRVDIVISGEVNEEYGWVMDFGKIKEIVNPFIDCLDHEFLNEIPGLEIGTSENLVEWLWGKLNPLLPGLKKIVVWESPRSQCSYTVQ